MENGLSIAEKIVAMIMILGGVVGSLVTAIGTARRAKKESEAKIEHDKAELASELEAEEIEKELRKIELADQLKTFYDKMIKEMNERSKASEAEIQKLRDEVAKNAEELETVKRELKKVRKEKETLRDAGILLIRAIEESLVNRDPDCSDPVQVNSNVLDTLNEVKILFENGSKKQD